MDGRTDGSVGREGRANGVHWLVFAYDTPGYLKRLHPVSQNPIDSKSHMPGSCLSEGMDQMSVSSPL